MRFQTYLTVFALFVVLAASAGFNTQKYLPGKKIRLFPDITAATYSKIDGASIAIEFGYQYGADVLECAKSATISVHFDTTTGVLNLMGRDSTQAYVDLIRSATFTTKSVDGKARQVSWSLGANTVYLTQTGHFYKFVPRTGQNWEDGKKACESDEMKYFGMRGYLATLTSEAEYDEIAHRFRKDTWIGGTDKDSRSNWRWTVGPEGLEDGGKGRLFWIGGTTFQGGHAPNHGHSMWARFQPDNELGSQMYLSLRHHSPYGLGFHDEASSAVQDGFLCEYGGMDSVEIEATKKYYEGSAQLVPGCEMLTDQASCVNQGTSLGCQFIDSKCRLTSCLQYTSEAKCDAAWNCHFNLEASPPVCENTECSKYRSKESCLGDLNCKAKDPNASPIECVPAYCSDRTTSPSDCAKTHNGYCSYSPSSSTCVADDYLDCPSMDIVFVVDGSPTMKEPFGRYGPGMDAIMELLGTYGTWAPLAAKDTDFGLRLGLVQFGTNAPRIQNGKLTLVSSVKDWMDVIVWHENAFETSPYTYPSQVRGNITVALQKAQEALLSSPRTTATKVIFIITQADFGDSIAAKTVINASPNIKYVGLVVRRQEVPGIIGSLDYNGYVALQALTTNRAANVDVGTFEKNLLGLCGNTALGIQTNFQSNRCSASHDKTSCEANAQCAWDSSESTDPCIASHCTALPADKCTSDIICQSQVSGTTSYCARKNSCLASKTEAACKSVDTCSWNTAGKTPACVDRCQSNPNEDACEADVDKCAYNPKAATPCVAIPCVANNEKDCVNIKSNKCAWSGSTCYLDFCGSYSANQTLCNLQPQCEYDTVKKTCISNICGKIVEEKKCDNIDACMWNVGLSPAVCSKRPCAFYNSKDTQARALCLADSSCAWVLAAITKTKDMCMPITCQTRSTAQDCSALSQCVWRDQQCRQNKFVQCSAIDVVFMIESSEVMVKSFGRHTNGLAALTQGIRQWAREAPLATNPTAPGFRVATVLFGVQEGVKLAASGQRGGKGKLTGNLNEILDELAFNEESDVIGSKELKRGTSVYIQPALQYATSLFDTSIGSTRKRVIMLLGHSNIADGDKVANDITKTVNENGIHIFSNHIRRFESITDEDVVAASMYQPLASDDIANHFSTSTVDNVDDNVIMKICDPTTPVGKALNISKSGDIPCGWLQTVDDCNTQNYCDWDPTASPTCPDPTTQCPNFGCAELPKSLRDQGYTCNMCTMTNGAFDCSKTQTQSGSGKGACVVSTCQKSARDSTTCPGTCTWSDDKASCVKKPCDGLSKVACNANYGCYWNMDTTAGRCDVNECGRFREYDTCLKPTLTVQDVVLPKCVFTVSPATCQNGAKCSPLCRYQECYTSPKSEECTANSLCEWDAGLNCVGKACDYNVPTGDCDTVCMIGRCNADSQCFWQPHPEKAGEKKCQRRKTVCVYEDGTTSACSASCGKSRKAIATKKILGYPLDPEVSCDPLEKIVPCAETDPKRDDCQTWCATFKDASSCSQDNSCYWDGTCKARVHSSCADLSTEGGETSPCQKDATCSVMENLCVDKISACNFEEPDVCNNMGCTWMTPQKDATLYGPGTAPATLFQGMESADIPDGEPNFGGATVFIEENYILGKDILIPGEMSKSLTAMWYPSTGALKIFPASDKEIPENANYAEAIANVRFFTSSTSRKTRTISWSFGRDTFFLSKSNHHYRYIAKSGASWVASRNDCASNKLGGYIGYLASVNSIEENNLLSTKMNAEGWLSGTDSSEEGTWKWSAGPDEGKDFWRGGSVLKGGNPASAFSFSNWEPATNMNPAGEPSNTQTSQTAGGEDYLYFNPGGYWADKDSITFSTSAGYICEFKGASGDTSVSYDVGGSVQVAVSGCLPPDCMWHDIDAKCNNDVECAWVANVGCKKSCATYSTMSECATRAGECRWSKDDVPARCMEDACIKFGTDLCSKDARCRWDFATANCVYRVGCEINNDKTKCEDDTKCQWDELAESLVPNCRNKQCAQKNTKDLCSFDPTCQWKDTTNGQGLCIKKVCDASDPILCNADSMCTFLNATYSSVALPPGGVAVTPFATVAVNSDYPVEGMTISIAEGYEGDADYLLCDAVDCPPSVMTVVFKPPTLFVKLISNMSATKMTKDYLQKVKFRTTSNSPRRRVISYALGVNMVFVPVKNGGYFHKYVDLTKDYDSASAYCKSLGAFHNEFQPSLSPVLNEADSLALRNIKAKGVVAAKESATTKCDWSWEGQTSSFWSGCGNAGALKGYAQWEIGYPLAKPTPQVVVVRENGQWRTAAPLSETGVICRFGNENSILKQPVGGYKTIQAQGCFPRVCPQYSTETECSKNTQCEWRGEACVADERCGWMTSPSMCNGVMNCFWDYDEGECTPGPRNMCNDLNTVECGDEFFKDACEWSTAISSGTKEKGSCLPSGCSKYPFKSVCNNNATCRWLIKESVCVPRLCGYQSEEQCWADKQCKFDHLAPTKSCKPNPCFGKTTDCAATGECQMLSNTAPAPVSTNGGNATATAPTTAAPAGSASCVPVRCAESYNADKCNLDPICIHQNGKCRRTTCSQKYIAEKQCDDDPECYFEWNSKVCQGDQCVMYNDTTSCASDSNCVWSGAKCRHITFVEFRSAPESGKTTGCAFQEKEPNLWWVYILLGLIVIGLAGIIWRLYMAYKHGYSFSDPKRYNKKFQAQELYSKELADMANDDVREANDNNPGATNAGSIDDL